MRCGTQRLQCPQAAHQETPDLQGKLPEGSQERAAAASLRVSWILAKIKRPFTVSGTVKDCMLAIVDQVINDNKMKTNVTPAIKNVSLSDTSNIHRVDIQALDVFVFVMLLDEVKKDRCAHFVFMHFEICLRKM